MEYIALYQRVTGDMGKRSGRKFVFPCWRCDAGQHGKRHFSVDPMTGRYWCYKCGFDPDGLGSGTARFFAKFRGYQGDLPDEGGISSYKEPPNHFKQEIATQVYTYLVDSLPLLDHHKEFIMNGRGIRRPQDFRIRSTVNAEAILKERFHSSMLISSGLFYRYDGKLIAHKTIWDDRILIPYIDADKQVTFIKTRRGNDDDTSKMKYAAPIDSEGSRRIWGRIVPGKTTLVVTEGEFKAIASVEARVLALGLPGMGSSHQALIDMIRGTDIKYIILCFDTQVKGTREVELAVNALSQRLNRELGVMVRRAYMPLEFQVEDGQKMDIDTYLYWHTPDEYKQILRDSVLLAA